MSESQETQEDLFDSPQPPVSDKPNTPLRKRLTEEFLRRVDHALERTSGNRLHAAVILGLDKEKGGTDAGAQRVKRIIEAIPWLKAKWTTSEKAPVAASATIDIHRAVPPIAPDKQRLVEAITQQDELMSRGLEKLGYKEQDVTFIRALQTQYVGNIQATLDLTYGAAVHSTVDMTLKLNRLNELLADIDANPKKYELLAYTREGVPYIVKDAHAYRMEVYDRAIKVADLLRKMNSSVNEATKTRLVADKLRREMAQGDKGPQAVAGWDVDVSNAQNTAL